MRIVFVLFPADAVTKLMVGLTEQLMEPFTHQDASGATQHPQE